MTNDVAAGGLVNSPPNPPTVSPRAASRLRVLAVAAVPAVLYLAIRGAGTLLLWGMTTFVERDFNLAAWDGQWYLTIAEHGYDADPATYPADSHGRFLPGSPYAFFPGYPQLVRVLAPLFGHQYLATAIVVSTIAGVAAAYGTARLAHTMNLGRRGQFAAVAMLAGAPMSVVYTMAYPEALLLATVTWALVSIEERRWWVAAPCVAAAGYISPIGAPLIAVAVPVAGLYAYRHYMRTLRCSWGAFTTAAVGWTGMMGYLLYVHQVTPNGYFGITNTGWHNRWDWGRAVFRYTYLVLTRPRDIYNVAVAVTVVVSVLLLVWARRRLSATVSAYTALTLVLAFGSAGVVPDRPRLLLSAVPSSCPSPRDSNTSAPGPRSPGVQVSCWSAWGSAPTA